VGLAEGGGAGAYFPRLQLLEEAQELAEATAPDDVAAEAADVIYFAMVREGGGAGSSW